MQRGNARAPERTREATRGVTDGALRIPAEAACTLRLGGRDVRLTNLHKLFWPELGVSKRDLLQYYADVSAYLLPHLRSRAMVMKRYPNGAYGRSSS